MRNDQGWTLRQMIVQHGFHLAQWQGFEKGKGISVPTLLRLCEVFDITLEELVANLGREVQADKPATKEASSLPKVLAKRTTPKRVPLPGGSSPPQAPRKG